jgi:hypothetical protein
VIGSANERCLHTNFGIVSICVRFQKRLEGLHPLRGSLEFEFRERYFKGVMSWYFPGNFLLSSFTGLIPEGA